MINRKKGPSIHAIKSIVIPPVDHYVYSNGIKVFEVNLGSQNILKIEIIHKAGRSVEDFHLCSRATSSLLKDGSSNKTSSQIAEEIDYYGSSIKTASNMDFSYSTIYTLPKHFEKIIPIIFDMYDHPTFPTDEIEKFKSLNIQKLKEELTKNDVITYRHITEEIFGKNHPYGYNSVEEDYLSLDKMKIEDHFQNYYGSDNCIIFLSGKITGEIRKSMEYYFGRTIKATKKKDSVLTNVPVFGKTLEYKSKNEHQSAIKTGRRLFDRHDPDNASFFVLNTLLGGYFGSRLMSSIREDKGLTYDIFSSIDQMLYDGCFYVSTETANEHVPSVLEEIYHQMHILQQEKVAEAELNMVKNYLMGNFMNMLDGPMNVSTFAKSMILSGQKLDDFYTFASEIITLDSNKIMEIAQKYLNKKDMTEIIVRPWTQE